MAIHAELALAEEEAVDVAEQFALSNSQPTEGLTHKIG